MVQKRKLPVRHLMVLVAMCSLGMAGLGIFYKVQGIFFVPMAEELGCGRGAVSVMLTIVNLTGAATGMVVNRLLDRWPLRAVILLGATMCVVPTGLNSLCHSLPPLYVLSAVCGVGMGIISSVLLTTVIGRWFVEGRSLATGIVFGSTGIAGAVFSPVVSAIIEGRGWRVGYLVSAALIAAFCLPAVVLPITLSPEEAGLAPLGGKASAAGRTAHEAHTVPGALPLALVLSFLCMFVNPITHHFPGLADSLGLPASVGAFMISSCMVVNSFGKVALGAMSDRFSPLASLEVDLGLTLLGVLGLLLVPTVPMVYVSSGLVGANFAFVTVGLATVVLGVFGEERYGEVYPLVNLAGAIGSALGATLIGVFYDVSGDYRLAFVVLSTMLAACMLIVAYLLGRPKEETFQK